MPATSVRLQHAELCSFCTDLLPVGTTVVVGVDRDVTCLSCAGEPAVLLHSDPWSTIDNAYLRLRLHQRNTGYRHPVSIPA